MGRFAIILLIISFAGGCKKDPLVPLNPGTVNECANFERCSGPSFGINYYDSTQFKAPCFNPNNADEFIYVYTNYNNSSLNGLYKYTISTHEKQKITSIVTSFPPKWGKNNWILFIKSNGDNREVYRIKSNGDSITQITSGHPDLYPDWDNKNNRIIFNRQIYLGSPASKIMIADFNSNLIDSIDSKYFHYGACNSIAELACPPYNSRTCGITVINSQTKSESLMYEPTKCLNMNQGTAWHPNNIDIYYTTNYGNLFKINKNTKSQSIIKSFCDTKTYQGISVSPDGTFLLVERIDGRIVECNAWFKSTIYKVAIDGSSETKVIME